MGLATRDVRFNGPGDGGSYNPIVGPLSNLRHAFPNGCNAMDLKIAGLRVLVTAGASGIGLATARAFAREGARVIICDIDRNALKVVAASDPGFAQMECDVSDSAAVSQLFDLVAAEFGGRCARQ